MVLSIPTRPKTPTATSTPGAISSAHHTTSSTYSRRKFMTDTIRDCPHRFQNSLPPLLTVDSSPPQQLQTLPCRIIRGLAGANVEHAMLHAHLFAKCGRT